MLGAPCQAKGAMLVIWLLSKNLATADIGLVRQKHKKCKETQCVGYTVYAQINKRRGAGERVVRQNRQTIFHDVPVINS